MIWLFLLRKDLHFANLLQRFISCTTRAVTEDNMVGDDTTSE